MQRISIVVPTLNEAHGIEQTLRSLQPLRTRGHEVLLVDGGSNDDTVSRAAALADRVMVAPRGRAHQMNAGAAAAAGDVILFLHADTRLPLEADRLLLDALRESGAAWGRFDVHIDGRHPLLCVVAGMMNRRSRLTGICTGDQALFVRRDAFRRAGGYPPIPLMEDIALSRALRRVGPPACLRECVHTSGRRWEQRGVLRTIALMWWLRLRYFFGASPARLLRHYDRVR